MDIIKTETVEPHESQEAAISTGENSEAENIFINGIKTEEPSTAKEEICHMSSRLSDVTEESTKKVSSRLNEARVNNAVNELHNEPTFAVICSFFNKFASFLGLKPQNFLQMEYLLSSFHQTGHVDKELIELHLALLRKLNFKSARANVWEKYLLKFCASSPALGSEYLQLERYGYIHAPISTKLAILKTLCECQFDYNSKFRESVANSLKACDLRLLPLGADMDGLSYWYQQDRELSVRIYTEEPDDHSGGSWNLVAKSKEDLQELLAKLRNSQEVTKDELSDSSHIEPKNSDDLSSPKFSFDATTKRGSFLDIFCDGCNVKPKNIPAAAESKERELSVEPEEDKVEETKTDEDTVAIPDELEQFIDRRVLPRRSARNAAIAHLKELTTAKKIEKKEQQIKRKRGRPPKKRDPPISIKKNESNEITEEEGEDAELFGLEDETDESEATDDDFMPLSEIKRLSQRKKRKSHVVSGSARKRRRKAVDPLDTLEEEEEESDDQEVSVTRKERKIATKETVCRRCQKSSNPEVLLLCDMCDDAWHTWCLRPMLWFVPDDDWFCPKCHHQMLLEKFSSVLLVLEEQLKKKAADDKRKEVAAERLKREMEYIGVSLNNIVPPNVESSEDGDYESDEDDGERRSKKRAIKLIGARPAVPVLPIALSRTRRHVAKVDYRFGAFDELIQEAVENIDDSSNKPKLQANPCRPKGGAGLGKDMANILHAEVKRVEHGDTCGPATEKPGKSIKSRRKLNDLDVDEMTESETDEYQASASDETQDDQLSDGSDEYIPSDDNRRKRSTRYSNKRTQSDDDFVVSSSESVCDSKWKKSRKSRNSKNRNSRTKKGKRKSKWSFSDSDSTSNEEDLSELLTDESSSNIGRRRVTLTKNKWAPRASSSEESEDGVQAVSASGRPLRKAACNTHNVESDVEDEEENDDKSPSSHKRSGTGRRAVVSSDGDDFEPDGEEEAEEDEDEEEEEEEENGDGCDREDGNDYNGDCHDDVNGGADQELNNKEGGSGEERVGKKEGEKGERRDGKKFVQSKNFPSATDARLLPSQFGPTNEFRMRNDHQGLQLPLKGEEHTPFTSQPSRVTESLCNTSGSFQARLMQVRKEGHPKKEEDEIVSPAPLDPSPGFMPPHNTKREQNDGVQRMTCSYTSAAAVQPTPIHVLQNISVQTSSLTNATDTTATTASVIQQMANFVSPLPVQPRYHFPATIITRPSASHASPFVPYIMSGSAPLSAYPLAPTVPSPQYRPPPNILPQTYVSPPERWHSYATMTQAYGSQTGMLVEQPSLMNNAATPDVPVSDPESLGNALASAMDY